ncbi:MAG: fumarate hydratase C-terminal domain-containing protein [Deltaproteobacteria bacterium]|nr:fumarate hydratase C-terminal domain-containing protein [Deltaproteobacteria bacterium]
MIRIDLPVDEKKIRELRLGDEVSLHGVMVTARDAAHKLMVEERPEFLRPLLENGAVYHCGPVMKKDGDRWIAVAAGPTTSIREEPYEADVMEEYKVRIVIGKGGLGPKTLAACQKVGAVYLHAVGGAAVIQAEAIKEVPEVLMLEELGAPEAFWVFRVDGFKGVVTMDSTGASLHETVFETTKKNRDKLIGL